MDFQKYNDIFNKKNYPEFEEISNCDKKTIVPKDNKVCICLSGKKYKDCCKTDIERALQIRQASNEIDEVFRKLYFSKDSKLISYGVEHKSIKKKNVSYCSAQEVFNNCDTTNVNRHSHTLSKGNVLKNLADNGDSIVVCFNDHKVPDCKTLKKNISEYYSEVLIKNASVTVSFCRHHDIELFSDIETDGNTEYMENDIQNLEYSLKAISFDVYYKIMNICYMAELIKENRNVVYNDDGTHSLYFENYYKIQKTLFDIYPLMLRILKEIKDIKEGRSVKDKLKSVCFNLPINKVNFSCSEIICIWQTYCFVNVINSKKPYIIISYYEEEGSNITEELNKLKRDFDKLNFSKDEQINILWGLIIKLLSNAQNIYFNKTAFEKLSDDEKLYLYIVHREGTYNIPPDIQATNNKRLKEVLFSV